MPTSDLPPNVDWEVELKFEDPPQSVTVVVEHQLLLGRTPNGQASIPAVDLSPFNAIELGVSRRHGIFTSHGDHVTYTDEGSDNGTIHNGRRLDPHETIRLKTGDALFLGHLKAHLVIKSRARRTSILAARPGLSFGGVQMQGNGQRVLIVEDDAGVAEMYRLALERSGYTVYGAREMVSAIRMLNHMTPAAIVLDVMLPGIRGLELARYIRRDTECPDIPIIVTSALTTPEAVKSAMESGVDIFMAKPLDWRELARVIGAMVTHSQENNPMLQTKKLVGTARLNFIPAATREDTIVMFIEQAREPMTAVVQPQITMGRQTPPGTPPESHINLDPYGAFDKGVSRVHATVRRIGKEFEIEDMNSANGTYLNGYSLPSRQTHPLKNGDEIRLGELRLHVYFLSETEIAER